MVKKARVTIKDVAKKANVTPQTVSRAFRNTRDISEKTKNRILKIAAELGYVKNSSATSLRCGTSRLIAVIYDNHINLYFSIMLELVQSSLRAQGYSTLTLSNPDKRLTKEAYLFALSHGVGGIFSFLEPEEGVGELIDRYHVPVLLFGRRTALKNVDYIYSNDCEGGRLAARKFIESGCKRVGYIAESMSITCVYDRYSGFETELKEKGLAPAFIVDTGAIDLENKVLAIYRDCPPPDGIFCFNDMLAFDVLCVLDQNGLPPTKIIGYDNLQHEIRLPRRLTTVGTDKAAMVEKATAMLVQRLQNADGEYMAKEEGVFLVDGTTT